MRLTLARALVRVLRKLMDAVRLILIPMISMSQILLRLCGLSVDKDQIAFASTISIVEIDDAVFEKGLQGRLCSGLEVRLGLPDEEMKKTFIRRMCAEKGQPVSDEVSEGVDAEKCDDFWKLRGAVCRWTAKGESA